jgi:hypothetical protein
MPWQNWKITLVSKLSMEYSSKSMLWNLKDPLINKNLHAKMSKFDSQTS